MYFLPQEARFRIINYTNFIEYGNALLKCNRNSRVAMDFPWVWDLRRETPQVVLSLSVHSFHPLRNHKIL